MHTNKSLFAQAGMGAMPLVAFALGWIVLSGVAALAQGGQPPVPEQQKPGMILELGAGGNVTPRFESSSDYLLSPYPMVRLKYIRFNNGFQIGGGDDQGFSFRPSFRYLSERSTPDYTLPNAGRIVVESYLAMPICYGACSRKPNRRSGTKLLFL